MEEPVVTEAQASREKQALRDLPGQLVQLVKDSIKVLRSCPLAAKLIVSAAVICVPSYLTKMFVQQRLVELGWPTDPALFTSAAERTCRHAGHGGWQAATPSPSAAVLHHLRPPLRSRVCTGRHGPCAGQHLGLYAGAGVLWKSGCLHEDRMLNDNIPSDQRATLISVDGMAYSLLMIPASPLVGAVGDAFGQAGAGLVVLGLLVAASGILIYKKQ